MQSHHPIIEDYHYWSGRNRARYWEGLPNTRINCTEGVSESGKKSNASTELQGKAIAAVDKQGYLKAAVRQNLTTGKSQRTDVIYLLRGSTAGIWVEKTLGAVTHGQQFGDSGPRGSEPSM